MLYTPDELGRCIGIAAWPCLENCKVDQRFLLVAGLSICSGYCSGYLSRLTGIACEFRYYVMKGRRGSQRSPHCFEHPIARHVVRPIAAHQIKQNPASSLGLSVYPLRDGEPHYSI